MSLQLYTVRANELVGTDVDELYVVAGSEGKALRALYEEYGVNGESYKDFIDTIGCMYCLGETRGACEDLTVILV